MIVFVILDGSGDAVEMADETFTRTVVTRHGDFNGEPVVLSAWGLSPAPFLKLASARRMKVAQDGGDFYQAEELPGFDGMTPLWRSPIRVRDHDMGSGWPGPQRLPMVGGGQHRRGATMEVEHLVETFKAGWTAKAWQERLDELAAEGWRFVQSIDRVDGFWVILVRARRAPVGKPGAR